MSSQSLPLPHAATACVSLRCAVFGGTSTMSTGTISYYRGPAAARHRLGFPEGQYFGAGWCPLSREDEAERTRGFIVMVGVLKDTVLRRVQFCTLRPARRMYGY